MNHTHIYKKEYDGATAEVFAYLPDEGVAEAHVMLHATDSTQPFAAQLEALQSAADTLLHAELENMHVVFGRYFLSDAANQTAASGIEQPPLDGTKVAQWLYLQQGGTLSRPDNRHTTLNRNGYQHMWTWGEACPGGTSYVQTLALLENYAASLRERACTLERNCVRTWFFVQNVDVNYMGMVKARNDVFAREGLSSDTHFIASTGIGGRNADPQAFVTMDAYAIDGLQPGQMQYLYARTHLNPTYEYGVSFERGATVDYGDRRHVFISGTASINNLGQVMHEGDIRKQTQRMWENVKTLLAEAGCTWENVGHMIVYLRDISDYATVKAMFDERFPNTPRVITYARVCRPGWLVEMECMAVKEASNPQFAPL